MLTLIRTAALVTRIVATALVLMLVVTVSMSGMGLIFAPKILIEGVTLIWGD